MKSHDFRNFILCIALLCFIFLLNQKANADTWNYQAEIAFENLNFIFERDDFEINDQETLEAFFELTYDNEEFLYAKIKPRFRFDFLDHSRNRYLPNESYLQYYSEHVEITGGFQLISWGVSNSYNPSDVINRRDFEDNFYDPEKMGEMILSAKGIIDTAGPFEELTFQALVLPFFQKAPLPQLDTRFPLEGRTLFIPFSVTDEQDTPSYLASVGTGMRVSATVGAADMALSYYHGPSKNPAYSLKIDQTGRLKIKPFYYTIDSIAFNVEAAVKDFVLHLEAAGHITSANDKREHALSVPGLLEDDAVPNSWGEIVPGFDYTFYNFAGKGSLRLSFEYLFSTERTVDLENFRPFQNDLFFGFQYDFNNTKGTRIEFGVIKDLGNKEAILISEISSRIYKGLKLAVGGVFTHRDGNLNSPLSFFENNSFFRTRLSYNFGGSFEKRNKKKAKNKSQEESE